MLRYFAVFLLYLSLALSARILDSFQPIEDFLPSIGVPIEKYERVGESPVYFLKLPPDSTPDIQPGGTYTQPKISHALQKVLDSFKIQEEREHVLNKIKDVGHVESAHLPMTHREEVASVAITVNDGTDPDEDKIIKLDPLKHETKESIQQDKDSSKKPDPGVSMYNQVVDAVLQEMNERIKIKNFDPLPLDFETVAKVLKKLAEERRASKNKHQQQQQHEPAEEEEGEEEVVPIEDLELALHEEVPMERGYRFRRKMKRDTKETGALTGSFHGLATLRRNKDVKINHKKGFKLIRAECEVGPLELQFEQMFRLSHGKTKSKAATASAQTVNGMLKLRVEDDGMISLKHFRFFRPEVLKVNGKITVGRTEPEKFLTRKYLQVTPYAVSKVRNIAKNVIKSTKNVNRVLS